jgi:hypothetical protein
LGRSAGIALVFGKITAAEGKQTIDDQQGNEASTPEKIWYVYPI